MEMLLPPEPRVPMRPMKRVEYERLVAEGFFENENVELLFGVMVEMAPIDPAHCESTYEVHDSLKRLVGARAKVLCQMPFAASEISEPQPDVFVVPNVRYWNEHPTHAFLVVEVSRSSLSHDRGIKAKVYGYARVDEYWVVNHVDQCVEVYRDARDGEWRSRSTHERGETITMLAFPDVAIAVNDVLPPEA
jgi:Uma2 family endonuclease